MMNVKEFFDKDQVSGIVKAARGAVERDGGLKPSIFILHDNGEAGAVSFPIMEGTTAREILFNIGLRTSDVAGAILVVETWVNQFDGDEPPSGIKTLKGLPGTRESVVAAGLSYDGKMGCFSNNLFAREENENDEEVIIFDEDEIIVDVSSELVNERLTAFAVEAFFDGVKMAESNRAARLN